MSAPRLASLVRLTGVPLEEIALSIAGELASVRAARARAQLDLLASSLDQRAFADPEQRAAELLEAIGTRAGFSVEGELQPASLMLDVVLEFRAGHPLALAIVYAGVARRAGVELFPIGDSRMVLLGDPEPQPPLAIDPVPGGRRLPAEMRWMCPHLVALRMLETLRGLYLNRGDLARAIRAAELVRLLPLSPATREGSEIALAGLRARLN